MKLLALDLSSHTGWACGEHVDVPLFGTFDLPKMSDNVGRFVAAYDEWLGGMLTLERVQSVAFEAPLLLTGGATNIVNTRNLMALTSHTEFVCHSRCLPCREANVSTVKKFWAGTGRAKKPDMIAAARRYGHAVKDDNQADALALWSFSVHHNFADQRHRWAAGQLGAAA